MRRGFSPDFVNYKKGCTRLAAASVKVFQLLAHGIVAILLKEAPLNSKHQNQSNH